MTFVFVFFLRPKMVDKFRFSFGSAENKMTFSAPVSFSAENVYTSFGWSLIVNNNF